MVSTMFEATLVELIGLSTDIKPIGYNNGTKFYEMDTGYTWRYDAQNKVWVSPDLDVKSITIKTAPSKTTYFAGETFNPAGMVVTVTFKDDDTKDISSGFTFSPSVPLLVTDTAVTISYGGKTATQAITVNPVVVQSIAVTTAPTKTAYAVGETFDPAGMVVTATYNNETTAVVTDYTYSPTAALTAEDTSVTITYEGKTATQAITVS